MTCARKRTISIALATLFSVCGGATAEPVILSCSGTIVLIQAGKQVNPARDGYSVAITIDLSANTLTVNENDSWPLYGDTSHMTVTAIGTGKGSATLNRITGSIVLYMVTPEGFEKFRGGCKPAQKLF